jgi:YjbE family integral membrane protein
MPLSSEWRRQDCRPRFAGRRSYSASAQPRYCASSSLSSPRSSSGILLLWVVWKLAREIIAERRRQEVKTTATPVAPPKDLRRALVQIVVADVSMSLDNVLAVAGAARQHLTVLIIGLALSVALMGVAATVIARLLKRYFWISYIGLAIIAWVAVTMIWEGGWAVVGGGHLPVPA